MARDGIMILSLSDVISSRPIFSAVRGWGDMRVCCSELRETRGRKHIIWGPKIIFFSDFYGPKTLVCFDSGEPLGGPVSGSERGPSFIELGRVHSDPSYDVFVSVIPSRFKDVWTPKMCLLPFVSLYIFFLQIRHV